MFTSGVQFRKVQEVGGNVSILRSENGISLRENQNIKEKLFVKVASSWTFSYNPSSQQTF